MDHSLRLRTANNALQPFSLYVFSQGHKAHISNIDALNSDTHTLRIQYVYTQKQCVGVAIEGMDIWYMGLTLPFLVKWENSNYRSHFAAPGLPFFEIFLSDPEL